MWKLATKIISPLVGLFVFTAACYTSAAHRPGCDIFTTDTESMRSVLRAGFLGHKVIGGNHVAIFCDGIDVFEVEENHYVFFDKERNLCMSENTDTCVLAKVVHITDRSVLLEIAGDKQEIDRAVFVDPWFDDMINSRIYMIGVDLFLSAFYGSDHIFPVIKLENSIACSYPSGVGRLQDDDGVVFSAVPGAVIVSQYSMKTASGALKSVNGILKVVGVHDNRIDIQITGAFGLQSKVLSIDAGRARPLHQEIIDTEFVEETIPMLINKKIETGYRTKNGDISINSAKCLVNDLDGEAHSLQDYIFRRATGEIWFRQRRHLSSADGFIDTFLVFSVSRTNSVVVEVKHETSNIRKETA